MCGWFGCSCNLSGSDSSASASSTLGPHRRPGPRYGKKPLFFPTAQILQNFRNMSNCKSKKKIQLRWKKLKAFWTSIGHRRQRRSFGRNRWNTSWLGHDEVLIGIWWMSLSSRMENIQTEGPNWHKRVLSGRWDFSTGLWNWWCRRSHALLQLLPPLPVFGSNDLNMFKFKPLN